MLVFPCRTICWVAGGRNVRWLDFLVAKPLLVFIYHLYELLRRRLGEKCGSGAELMAAPKSTRSDAVLAGSRPLHALYFLRELAVSTSSSYRSLPTGSSLFSRILSDFCALLSSQQLNLARSASAFAFLTL